jgi:hypothetical protein
MAYLWLEEAYTEACLYSSFPCYGSSNNTECLLTEMIWENINRDTLHYSHYETLRILEHFSCRLIYTEDGDCSVHRSVETAWK